MRGRTLAHAFVILDEAQNTTPVQMKMFLTRMGEDTRMVVTGDLSQIDLPAGTRSGLPMRSKRWRGFPASASPVQQCAMWCATRWSDGSSRPMTSARPPPRNMRASGTHNDTYIDTHHD